MPYGIDKALTLGAQGRCKMQTPVPEQTLSGESATVVEVFRYGGLKKLSRGILQESPDRYALYTRLGKLC